MFPPFPSFCGALYTTLHYTSLHYTTLLYTTLHYTTLHYTTLHYTTLHYTTLHYTTLHYTTLNYTTLHYTKLHYTTLHYTTLRYTTLHYTTLHYTTLHQLSKVTLWHLSGGQYGQDIGASHAVGGKSLPAFPASLPSKIWNKSVHYYHYRLHCNMLAALLVHLQYFTQILKSIRHPSHTHPGTYSIDRVTTTTGETHWVERYKKQSKIRKEESCPATTTATVSRSGYPPWILKRGGLESSGQIPSS